MLHKVFITGSAGFIGFHLAKRLLDGGSRVHGYDGMTEYYDINLKKSRNSILLQNSLYTWTAGAIEDQKTLQGALDEFRPTIIIHLAAQAGVRYSLENPRAYLDSNLVGTFNILEGARLLDVRHLMIASTSSVYGANDQMPFTEDQKADTQLTFYAATKKATESMAHSYAHLWSIPTTMLRFFTVYGPWGRPDLALFKFVDAILDGRPIDVYNNGDMYRDFTYIDDLIRCIDLLLDVAPEKQFNQKDRHFYGLSPVAPFRIVNIGNSKRVKLLEFIAAIEECLNKKAIYHYMPMQTGDVPATLADTTLLNNLVGYRPSTDVKIGIDQFIQWFRNYYGK